MTAEVPEEDLVRRYQNGDGEALCALFDRYEALLVRRIERWLPPHVLRRLSVSDVLQESRIVALDRREAFEARGDGAFRRWILGIAEMKARQAVQRHMDVAKRATRRELSKPARRDTAAFAGKGPTPSEVAIGSELEELARLAVRSLPDDYREVLRLAMEEGLTLKEAARRMGRSHDAAKKLYGRALARLARELRGLRGESHV